MKNNAAECVLLSSEEYVRHMDEVNNARLLAVATERMAHYDPTSNPCPEGIKEGSAKPTQKRIQIISFAIVLRV